MNLTRLRLIWQGFKETCLKKTGSFIPLTVKWSTLALMILPSVYFMFVSYQYDTLKPLFFGVGYFDYDAAYTYLISSISLTLGDIPNYADHPGTLNHIFIAFSLRIAQLFTAILGYSDSQCISVSCLAIDYPEQVLDLAGVLMLFFFSLSNFFLGWSFYQTRTTSIGIAILSQSVFLSAPNLLPYAKIINGETTGIPCLLMAGSLIILTNSINGSRATRWPYSRKWQLFGGALSGLYMSFVLLAKLSFLPASLLLAMHKRREAFVSSLLGLTIGFYFWGLSLTNWKGFKNYWFSITNHTGSYGSGSKGMIDWAKAFENLQIMIQSFPWLLIVVGVMIIAVALAFYSCRPASSRARLITKSFLLTLSIVSTVYGFVYATSNFRALLFGVIGLLLAWIYPSVWHSMVLNSKDTPHILTVNFLAQTLSILSTLKHYDARYLAVPISISAISVGTGLGSLESFRLSAGGNAHLSNGLRQIILVSLITAITVQGLTLSRTLNLQIDERNRIMAHDKQIIDRITKAYPNAELIGEYRIKGFDHYALAFAFLMGTTLEKANHIMAAYHNPERRFWIWLSGESEFWNQIDGKMTISEFRSRYAKQHDRFLFALPNQVVHPDLPIRKVAELQQNASIFTLFAKE